MMRKRRINKLVILMVVQFIILLCATGCWGIKETDQLGYILSTGIDIAEEDLIEVTFKIAVPQSEKGVGGEESTELVSIKAASIFGALHLADAFVSRDLTFIHNRVLVVSQDIAKNGINKYFAPLMRNRDIRRNTFLFVTKGKAREFLEKNKAYLEKYPSRQFELLMETGKITGLTPYTNLLNFYTDIKSPGKEPIAVLVALNDGKAKQKLTGNEMEAILQEMSYTAGQLPRKGGNKIDMIGTAVFKKDKLVGFLDGTETRYCQMVTGDFLHGFFAFPDPEKEDAVLVLEFKKGRSPDIKVNQKGYIPVVNIDIILEAEIMSIESGIPYEKGKKEQMLEDYIARYVTKGVEDVIKKTQEEFKSDIFGLGDYTRTNFLTWKQWEEFRWLDIYPEVEVKVNTKVEIRRTGHMSKTIPLSKEKY